MKRNVGIVFLLMLLITVDLCILKTKSPEHKNSDIILPSPEVTGGLPLMEALQKRQSHRSFSSRDISMQTLSNLLWAAFGINRLDGGRTAPSIMNWQETDIYVVLKQGCFHYNPGDNTLTCVNKEDLRAQIFEDEYGVNAPVHLIYVTDYGRMDGYSDSKKIAAYSDVGFIGQNVYLFCASEGLNTIIRNHFDHDMVHRKLALKDQQWITYSHTIGYP